MVIHGSSNCSPFCTFPPPSPACEEHVIPMNADTEDRAAEWAGLGGAFPAAAPFPSAGPTLLWVQRHRILGCPHKRV